jgi:hypothetical protein
MNKYQRGKIYKIWSPNTERIYIGSTTESTLAKRMAKHRADYQRWKEGHRQFITSFVLLNQPECQIQLLEVYPCNSKDELRAQEQFHIDANAAACVNKYKAFYDGTTQNYNKEYYLQNQNKIKQKSAEWYSAHKPEAKQQSLRWKEANKEKVRQYKIDHYVKNKEVIAQRSLEHYIQTKINFWPNVSVNVE